MKGKIQYKRIKAMIYLVLSVVLTLVLAVYGFHQRGYFGVGGEFLVPLILYILMYLYPECHRDFKRAMNDEWF